MTRIKYVTIGRSRKTNHILIVRGKKTGQIGFRQPDDSEDAGIGVFDDPIYSEEVVELPSPMSPSECREYVSNINDPDDAVVQAYNRVADEYDMERWSPDNTPGDSR